MEKGPVEQLVSQPFTKPGYGRMRRASATATTAGPWHHMMLWMYQPNPDDGSPSRAVMALCGKVFYSAAVELIDLVPVGEWCGQCGSQEHRLAPLNPEATPNMFEDRTGQCRRTVILPAEPDGDPIHALCPAPAVRDDTCAEHLGLIERRIH